VIENRDASEKQALSDKLGYFQLGVCSHFGFL